MSSDFGILGELQVLHDGAPRALGSARQRALLARLIIKAGSPISADRLIDELWPDDVPSAVRHTLHVYVSRLRATLGADRARLQSGPSGYRLVIEPDELDASRFERLAAEGRAALAEGHPEVASARLGQALALWRGPALAEFAEEAFASGEAARLEQLRLSALEDRILADLDLGRHADLTQELRALTLEQPFREVFWEQYMLALYRSGRQADALHAFGEARMLMVDELGIEPGPALREMEQRILAQAPSLAATSPATSPATTGPGKVSLPLQRTTFVGRERDLAIAAELLSATRLLTLTGAPGSGKTRTALRLASDHAERFPDGVSFVPLATVTDAAALDAAIARALDLPESPDQAATERLVSHLRDRCQLLVLDNFEHLVEAAPRVGALLDGAPDLTILVTSRAPLSLAGEQEFPVLPLQVPPASGSFTPSSLLAYDAVTLLVARARASDPSFDVSEENATALAGIATRLDGLPLALELGAGRLRLLTPQELLARLEEHSQVLATRSSDVPARHQTLRAAISWSFELLDPSEQTLFRRLAPFNGGFTAEAASAVSEMPLEDAWNGIESLLSKSLLSRPADVGKARFSMLETLREFALEELQRTGEQDDVAGRHARFFLGLAEAAEPQLTGASQDEAFAVLSQEIENIRSALRYSMQTQDVDLGLRLVSSIWRFWHTSGQMIEGRRWLEQLLAGPDCSTTVRAKALEALAGLAYWQADSELAWSSYQEALDLYRADGDQVHEAEVLYGMSMTATWMGDLSAGTALAAEARALFEAQGDRAKVGEALMAQGFALLQAREYDAARPLWDEALGISRELADEALVVTQLAGIAAIEFHADDRTAALRIALEGLALAREHENVALSVWLLDFIAAFAAADAPTTAVRVAGAADALRVAAGGGMRIEDLHIESARSAASRSLSPAESEEAWAAGRAMTLDQAAAAVDELRLGSAPATERPRAASTSRVGRSTRRARRSARP